jgi:TIR domain
MREVFLAYSSKDVKEAATIVGALGKMGLKIWWDRELPARSEWAFEIGRALKRSDSMIILITPRSMDSDLVMWELRYGISHANFRERVFPVMIEPTAALPAVFSMLDVFDLTEDRGRGLRNLAKTIKEAKREPAAGGQKARC